jgi:hypothetical protein
MNRRLGRFAPCPRRGCSLSWQVNPELPPSSRQARDLLLSGKRGDTEVDVSAFLAVVHVTGAERGRLRGICREQNTPGWLQQHGIPLPQQLRTLIDSGGQGTREEAGEAAGADRRAGCVVDGGVGDGCGDRVV